MQAFDEKILQALTDLQQGKIIILTDHPDREDEGDLVCAAEHINTDKMNFMIRHGTGIVCLSLPESHLKKLDLPLMTQHNTTLHGTPFTLPIDAKVGITTGVSACDRVITIQTAIAENAQPQDLTRPGHVFPLQAAEGGVLARTGHTEGALDLMTLAGLKPAAVICEIMNEDGTMARGKQLKLFAQTHRLNTLSIEELVTYRLRTETLIEEAISASLPLDTYGHFEITVIKEKYTQHEHVILTKAYQDTPLVRIHSACMTGDLFHSKRCDCHAQLHHSLQRISEEGGMLIYLNQEGRGIGLFNKIKAYALQETGFDTIEANQQLGLPVDARHYYIAAHVLKNRGVTHVRLLTNNPEKINDLKKYGDFAVEPVSLPSFCNEHNVDYLNVKKNKLNHLMKDL